MYYCHNTNDDMHLAMNAKVMTKKILMIKTKPNKTKTLLISAFIFRQTAKGLETVHADLHFIGYKSATNYSRLKSGRENLQPGTIMAAASTGDI